MEQVDNYLKDKVLFIKKFVTEPRTIGSVTPSSPQLAASMVSKVNWSTVKTVAEFGAGTGVMTKVILERMKPGTKLYVFEIEDELRKLLSGETGLDIYGDASRLPQVLKNDGLEKVDLIVSSLPFAVLPHHVTQSILYGISSTLSDSGNLVAFQYSLHMRHSFMRIFDDIRIRFVMMNIPPAFVYDCRKPKRPLRQPQTSE